MNTQEVIAAYDKALDKVNKKPCVSTRVFYGVYLASDRDGKVWEVSQQIESPGKPWLAQSYPVSHRSDVLDPLSTKSDVLYALGFE
jgi:hypothetical protein